MTDHLSPQWASSALVLIDVQRDFVDGPSAIPGTAEKVDAMARVLDAFRGAHRPIVHVVRSYRAGESDVDSVRRAAVESGSAAVQPGSDGARIPSALVDAEPDWELLRSGRPQTVGADELVLYKPRWSAFHRTNLDGILRDRGVTTVVVAGCNLPNCPRATLFDATERDYRAVLVTDATSQTTPERLADLELIGVRLCTVAEVVDQLRPV
ncbi:cysteine hydrolase family protein [Gordonia sp. (in: high G+C Gram-positive bacteria)]|uniref:cysteine hydrolase family protein n=1 Tax=Gordonia sp. (in: high G+C Gram-positive bacteria) TaxID=84139 RepID=UPI0039E457FB